MKESGAQAVCGSVELGVDAMEGAEGVADAAEGAQRVEGSKEAEGTERSEGVDAMEEADVVEGAEMVEEVEVAEGAEGTGRVEAGEGAGGNGESGSRGGSRWGVVVGFEAVDVGLEGVVVELCVEVALGIERQYGEGFIDDLHGAAEAHDTEGREADALAGQLGEGCVGLASLETSEVNLGERMDTARGVEVEHVTMVELVADEIEHVVYSDGVSMIDDNNGRCAVNGRSELWTHLFVTGATDVKHEAKSSDSSWHLVLYGIACTRDTAICRSERWRCPAGTRGGSGWGPTG
ncbi:MAG: hypothetical protein AAGF11_55695 [Myxococcota bacterium]